MQAVLPRLQPAHLQRLREGWQTGFEPATAGTTIRPPLAVPRSNPAWQAALRAPSSSPPKLDMSGYAAIVGVFMQKCGFLHDREYSRFKGVVCFGLQRGLGPESSNNRAAGQTDSPIPSARHAPEPPAQQRVGVPSRRKARLPAQPLMKPRGHMAGGLNLAASICQGS